jgi:hypothetical protein
MEWLRSAGLGGARQVLEMPGMEWLRSAGLGGAGLGMELLGMAGKGKAREKRRRFGLLFFCT